MQTAGLTIRAARNFGLRRSLSANDQMIGRQVRVARYAHTPSGPFSEPYPGKLLIRVPLPLWRGDWPTNLYDW